MKGKKTTNPVLVKRYLAGKAEPGDHSKSFVVTDTYALVFNEKLPYRTAPDDLVVLSRDIEGKFTYWIASKVNHPARELTWGLVKDNDEIKIYTNLTAVDSALCKSLSRALRATNQELVDVGLKEFNEQLESYSGVFLEGVIDGLWRFAVDLGLARILISSAELSYDKISSLIAPKIMEYRLKEGE